MVTPIGIGVIFYLAGFDTGSAGVQSLISLILFLAYLASYHVFKKDIFIFFSIIFGTWLFFAFTNMLVAGYYQSEKLYEYRILITGLSYLLLGYYFSEQNKSGLKSFLYGFGVLGFLGAALALGGWHPAQNVFWEAIFPFLVFGVLFLSVYLKSNSFLVFGSLFLMGYILKLTSEYFSQSLGWPLALVIAGFFLIAIGYGSFYLKRKYISE
jgi:hypothetical protein